MKILKSQFPMTLTIRIGYSADIGEFLAAHDREDAAAGENSQKLASY